VHPRQADRPPHLATDARADTPRRTGSNGPWGAGSRARYPASIWRSTIRRMPPWR
jgi:hypothetical protein